MFVVEVYAAVRQFVFNDGKSRREAARVFGLSRETVSKMCRFSMPPGYVRQRPAEKPKLGPLIPAIEAILEVDRTAAVKQRHTAKRIFERLRGLRQKVPRNWSRFRDSVTDNFRVINPKDFRVVT